MGRGAGDPGPNYKAAAADERSVDSVLRDAHPRKARLRRSNDLRGRVALGRDRSLEVARDLPHEPVHARSLLGGDLSGRLPHERGATARRIEAELEGGGGGGDGRVHLFETALDPALAGLGRLRPLDRVADRAEEVGEVRREPLATDPADPQPIAVTFSHAPCGPTRARSS